MTLISLKRTSRDVLRALARQSTDRRISIKEIATVTDLSPATVRRHIRLLSAEGHVITERPNRVSSYRYTVPTSTKLELLNIHD